MKNIAVILAGGTGTRAGGGVPKQFRLLKDGRTVLETCVDAFAHCTDIAEIIVVSHIDYISKVREILIDRNIEIVAGGAERWESSWNAIMAIGETEANVLIHDCARPFVSQDIICRVCEALNDYEAVTVAVPATDTLYRMADGCVAEIPNRAEYMRAQTPQAFRIGVVREAYKRALHDPKGICVTDACGIVKRYMGEVLIYVVAGEETNKKLTFKEDFE